MGFNGVRKSNIGPLLFHGLRSTFFSPCVHIVGQSISSSLRLLFRLS
jgi:hypothetical protein